MIEKSNDQEFVTFDNPVSQVKLSFEYPDISPIVKSRHKTSIDSEIAINQADENFISKKLHDRILLDLAMKHNIELEAERNHGMELFSKKAAEYEKLLTTNEKIKEKKFKQQHRSVELLEAELLDLQSAIHQCRLNEEIMKKQYQALIMQSEKQVKEYVDNLSKAREEIEYYKISKPLEIEKDIVTVRSRIENLNLQVDLKNREIREKDQQLLLIHSKFQDRERVLAELEQKILTLEQENLKQKEQQFEAGALKYNLEDEKRRRLSLENDYELLQKENETSRQRLRKELELNYSQQLNILDSKNRHLQDELEKLLTEKNT